MKKNNILILGGDGYLGWSLGLAFANRTNFNVVLADNMIKRSWEKEVGARSLVPFKNPAERIAEYKRIFKKNNLSFQKLELLNYEEVVKTIKKIQSNNYHKRSSTAIRPFFYDECKKFGGNL